MFVITDPENLWVMVDITERELPDIHPGDTLVVHTTAFPGKKFPGKILKLGDMLDPSTRTAKVRGSVENLGGLLKPEIYVNVDIISEEKQKGIEIPSKAVLFIEGKRYVFLEKKPGDYIRTEVHVAEDHDEKAVVTKGLNVGDKVVEDGGLYLQAVIDNTDGD
jgi:RND family efflux transporter MFP subunit